MSSSSERERRKILRKKLDPLARNVRDDSLRRLRTDTLACLESALDAVHPERVVRESLRLRHTEIQGESVSVDSTSVHLLAVGKAAVPMASQALMLLPVASGLVVTNQPTGRVRHDRVRVIVASHPLPGKGSLVAAREALALVNRLRPSDLLLALISGGASAMFEASPVPIRDLRSCYAALLRSGLSIRDVNEVRKGLSEVKGGRLAERAARRGARVVSLIISDIVGDPIEDIGSGPTAPKSSRGARAAVTLRKANLWEAMPASVKRTLSQAANTRRAWRDTSGRVRAFIVAGNEQACKAARKEAIRRGYASRIWTTSLRGEARQVGPAIVSEALRWNSRARSIAVIAGGETTVAVQGEGQGGRNQEFALSTAEMLEGEAAVLLACGTDGVDGNTNAAGAIVDGTTMTRARKAGLNPRDFLKVNNSYAFFKHLDDRVITGPTGTNVADLILLFARRPMPAGSGRTNRSSRTRETSGTRRSHPRGRPARRFDGRR